MDSQEEGTTAQCGQGRECPAGQTRRTGGSTTIAHAPHLHGPGKPGSVCSCELRAVTGTCDIRHTPCLRDRSHTALLFTGAQEGAAFPWGKELASSPGSNH